MPTEQAHRHKVMRDPVFREVVDILETSSKYRLFAEQCPDLAHPSTYRATHPVSCSVILLHGGLSNCLEDFHDGLFVGPEPRLSSLPAEVVRLYRFEHDTWLDIATNTNELVELIERKVRSRYLMFIGHSRGGLIAARTAAKLRERNLIVPDASAAAIARGVFRDLAIMNFGTPHRGFGIASAAIVFPRTVYCLQRLVSQWSAGVPISTRARIFLKALLQLKRLPPGIAQLSPANEELVAFIRSGGGQWVSDRLCAFGAVPAGPTWLPAALSKRLIAPVPGIGDGAVSLSSAIGHGMQRTAVPGATHNTYFKRVDIRRAIINKINGFIEEHDHFHLRGMQPFVCCGPEHPACSATI